MKTLVCGGRDFTDYTFLCDAMASLPFQPTMIIHGGAKGGDQLAQRWAIEHGVHSAEVPALWKVFGESAGPRRNAAMLLLKPDYCVALPGGAGTADMIRKCEAQGIPTWVLTTPSVSDTIRQHEQGA